MPPAAAIPAVAAADARPAVSGSGSIPAAAAAAGLVPGLGLGPAGPRAAAARALEGAEAEIRRALTSARAAGQGRRPRG
mgnify:CR=1 FL=1